MWLIINPKKTQKKKNQTAKRSGFFKFRCPEQDSNLHTVTGTSPSSWRVYQFHHLGDIAQGPGQRAQCKSLLLHALCSALCASFCAQNRTRTCTSLLTLVPETSASTNFAIWAFCLRAQGGGLRVSLLCCSVHRALRFVALFSFRLKNVAVISGCKNRNNFFK